MIEDIEKQIQLRADERGFDVLIKLLDILKEELKTDMETPTSTLLQSYIKVKILRHRVRKKIRDGWALTEHQEKEYERKLHELTISAYEARRKYYESKRRDEERGI